MTGYPPGCPQNGSNRLSIKAVSDGADYWPGDTTTDRQGNHWRVDRNGDWQCLGDPAKKTSAA